MQLINLRGIPLHGFEITLKRIVELDLENLPLATNIFISLLQERLWCEKAKKKIETKEVNTNEGCEMEAILTGFQSNLNEEMVKFSLRSTESPHIRGIAGLVNIAVKRLVQEPSALCLVLLVAIAGPKGLNLSGMCSSWSKARLYSKLDIDPEDVDGMRLVSAVECLLGPEGSVREFALELALSTGLVTRQSSIPILQMHQLLISYIQDYVLNDCGPLACWVAVTPTTVKYMISVLAFEHYFMTSGPLSLLGFPIVERDMLRNEIVNEAISWSVCIHLGRALFTCQDKKLPRYLMCLFPFLLAISLPRLYPKEATKENLGFLLIMTAIGNSHEVHGGPFSNYLLWVLLKFFKAGSSDKQTGRKFQTALEIANFMFAYPSSKPPHNLFDFYGTPNLTWQSFVITNVNQCDTGKVVKNEVWQLATAVQLFCKHVLQLSSLPPSAVLTGPSHQNWASDLTRPFDNSQQANRKTVTWCINNLVRRVEDLFKLQRYPELVRLLLSKETRLIIGHNDFEATSGEGNSQMDILLAGSIVFSCLGLQKKTREWCGELLQRIQNSGNRGGTYARYQSIAYAVIGYNLLLENNISQSLKFFSLSVCSIGSEIQSAWALADEGIEKFCSLLFANAEIVRFQSFLSWFLMQKSELDFLEMDAFHKPFYELDRKSTDKHQGLEGLVSFPILSSRRQFSTKSSVRRTLVRVLGQFYQDGFYFFEKKNFGQSKLLFSHWLEYWHELDKLCPPLKGNEVSEGATFNILVMHVLRALGYICEREGHLPEACRFYERSLVQLDRDGLFMDIHLARVDLHCDLARVLVQLGKTREAEEHYKRIAFSKLAIFGDHQDKSSTSDE